MARRTVRPDVVEGRCGCPSGRGRFRWSPDGSRRPPSGRERSRRWWLTSALTRYWLVRAWRISLAAWVAVGRARASGRRVMLTAELGLWGYSRHRRTLTSSTSGSSRPPRTSPTHRPYWAWSSVVLVRRRSGCLGAAEVDRAGSLNSTQLAGGRFLVGSGGANNVASRATACVVVTLARTERLPETVAYVTSPGAHAWSASSPTRVSFGGTTVSCGWRPSPPGMAR